MKTVFEVEFVDIIEKKYAIRKTRRFPIGIYASLKRAENAIKRYVSWWDLPYTQGDDVLAFFIRERCINPQCYVYDNPNDDFISCRTYYVNGDFYEENMVDRDGVFRGRPVERSFKVGDIVEAYHDDVLMLAIVSAEPPHEEIPGVMLEMCEDRYGLIPIEGYPKGVSVECQYVFPLFRKISKKLQERLREKLKSVVDSQ